MESPTRIHEPPTFGAVILVIATIVASIGLVVAGTWFAVYNSNQNTTTIKTAQQASCDFWKALATAPIAPAPPVKAPSKFGVTIVLSSLEAYNGTGCGHLAPSPSLSKWAGYYHLAIPG